MTELFTASYRAFRPDWGFPVVTSRGLPRWRPESSEWCRYCLLTPTAREFELTGEAFRSAYIGRLERYGVDPLAASLEAVARHHEADRLVLLCFEESPSWCHRGDLAAWWLGQTGEDIAELN